MYEPYGDYVDRSNEAYQQNPGYGNPVQHSQEVSSMRTTQQPSQSQQSNTLGQHYRGGISAEQAPPLSASVGSSAPPFQGFHERVARAPPFLSILPSQREPAHESQPNTASSLASQEHVLYSQAREDRGAAIDRTLTPQSTAGQSQYSFGAHPESRPQSTYPQAQQQQQYHQQHQQYMRMLQEHQQQQQQQHHRHQQQQHFQMPDKREARRTSETGTTASASFGPSPDGSGSAGDVSFGNPDSGISMSQEFRLPEVHFMGEGRQVTPPMDEDDWARAQQQQHEASKQNQHRGLGLLFDPRSMEGAGLGFGSRGQADYDTHQQHQQQQQQQGHAYGRHDGGDKHDQHDGAASVGRQLLPSPIDNR